MNVTALSDNEFDDAWSKTDEVPDDDTKDISSLLDCLELLQGFKTTLEQMVELRDFTEKEKDVKGEDTPSKCLQV